RTPTRTSFSATSPYHSLSASHPNPSFPLDTLTPQFAELSDSLQYLQENLSDLQQMHESLSRFSESFAGFLYGLNMNGYCVEFPEAPGKESWEREREGALDGSGEEDGGMMEVDGVEVGADGRDAQGRVPRLMTPGLTPGRGWKEEETFMTNETSFVQNPVEQTPAPAPRRGETKTPATRGRGGSGIPARGRGAARGAARGATRGAAAGRGIPRPRARGSSSFK
ncbi:hypothetical protein BJ508DRAFT_38423, partial [Ascobolus immersus RN42]